MKKRPLPALALPNFARRVVSRLSAAEASESDPWMRDDLRIARLTVVYAASGEAVLCAPDVLASYMVLGLHPDKAWPAIQARRDALLGPLSVAVEVRGAPKKPPQSDKLWCEKTYGVRAVNSHADVSVLREPTISVPMAAPSIASLYPKLDGSSSAKKPRTYSEWIAAIRWSGAPRSVRNATLNALTARGPWPEKDGPINGVICVSLKGMMSGNEGSDGNCVRSTARWRARRAVRLNYWRKLRGANSWSNCPKCGAKRVIGTCGTFDAEENFIPGCGYRGRAKTPEGRPNFDEFCRPHMYEIALDKFLTAARPKGVVSELGDARTYDEYREAQRNFQPPPQPPPAPPLAEVTPIRKAAAPTSQPPVPTAPLPKQEKPAAESPRRNHGRHTYRETKAFKDRIDFHVAGCHGSVTTPDHASIYVSATSNPELYRAPLNRALAFKRTLEEFKWTVDSAIEALKYHGFSLEPAKEEPPG